MEGKRGGARVKKGMRLEGLVSFVCSVFRVE